MRTSSRARPLLDIQISHKRLPQLSCKQTVFEGESKHFESQSIAASKPTAELLFICNILRSERQNHLKKIALWVAALTNTSKKAWSLVAAVIPPDAHCTNSLVPVRYELGPWPLPRWSQPQVSTAIHLSTYTKLLGSSFPIAATRAAGWVEEDLSNRSRQAGTHMRTQAQTMPPREPRFLRKPAQNPPLTFPLLPARPRLLRCWCNVKHRAGKQRHYWLTFLQD